MATLGDDWAVNELEANVWLDELIYCPGIRRSEQQTVGIPPQKLGFEMAYTVTEPSRDRKVPVIYEETVS